LSERRADINSLVNLFIQKFNRAQSKKVAGVTPEAIAVLKKYEWPGNIRELENIIEHAFILEESNLLQVSSLPESILRATGTELSAAQLKAREDMLAHGSHITGGDEGDDDLDGESLDGSGGTSGGNGFGGEEMVKISGETLDFNKHKEAFEREFIIKALKMFKGRINQTALHANIPKKTLLRKIEKYGINARDYVE
ncbi:MAG: AAA-type ATPase lid domain-containing protein, partial [Bdellovibrionales bacterium]